MTRKNVSIKRELVEKNNIPNPDEEIFEGVFWGDTCALFTPAYWKAIYQIEKENKTAISNHRLGKTLSEEVAACLLGGYGIPSEIGLAAYSRVKERGLLNKAPTFEECYEALAEPLKIGHKTVRYRFAKQKADYLHCALKRLSESKPPLSEDLELREWLLGFKGIGYKTASWITRNWLGSDQVAIIDIHIHRAGLLAGFYNQKDSPSKNYLSMEERFIKFAQVLEIKASDLDALIWRQMKNTNYLVLQLLQQNNLN
jgi:thermostable 8-oxoguanine DNA glycosylase